MSIAFSCIHGSKLYGVDTEDSDTDIKGVYLSDSLDDYLKAGGDMPVKTYKTGNGRNKVEGSLFHIRMFAHKLCNLESNSLSLVFVPRDKWLMWSNAWEELVENKHRLICKKIGSLLGQAATQLRSDTGFVANPKRNYNSLRATLEAIEFLRTGQITYPSLDRQLLIDVKSGLTIGTDFKEILIYNLDLAKSLEKLSSFSAEPDRQWLVDWAIRWQKLNWGL